MKHTFAKQALLFGALSLLINTVPVHAMMQGEPLEAPTQMPAQMPAEMKQEVATKTSYFSGWSQERLQKQLDVSMKFFKRQWKCVTGKGCDPDQVKNILKVLGTILAIIGALTIYTKAEKWSDMPYVGKPMRGVAAGKARARAGASAAGEYVRTSRAGQAVGGAYESATGALGRGYETGRSYLPTIKDLPGSRKNNPQYHQ